jgi:phosphoglycolate phosphatase-like HAD superfamily hydrolase
MIRGVIFDYDDTLVATISTKWSALKRVATKYGIQLKDSDIAPHWGKPFDQQITDIFGEIDRPDVLIKLCKQESVTLFSHLLPGVQDTLEFLFQNNYVCSILSSGTSDVILPELKHNRIDPKLFLKIQTSDESLVQKPDPAALNSTLELFLAKGITSNELLIVGDSLRDYQLAYNARIKFVGVTTGLTTELDFKNRGCNLTIANLSKLLHVINNL